MAESTLTSTYEDLRVVAGLEMGWGRDPDTHWTDTNDTDFGIACKEGYRNFLYPISLPGENKSHNWSFLYPIGSLQLTVAHTSSASASATIYWTSAEAAAMGTSGSVSVGTGLGAETWPSWVTDGNSLWIDDEPILIAELSTDSLHIGVNSSHSDHDISTSPVVAYSSTSWNVPRRYYALPDDFGGMASDSFTYRRDEQWHLPQIKIVGEAEIRKVDRANDGNVYPRYASITPVSPVAAVEQSGGNSTRWRVSFYPRPEQTYEVEYRYHAIPPALDESTNIYHYGGAEHSQTIIAAVVDALYRRVHSSNEKSEEFHNRLKQSILHDRRNYNTGNLGQKLQYADGRDALRDFRENTPTGNITTTFY